ncbi:DEAD-box ATP-dependent RNA helicase 52C-like [Olea europaea var. sylvestris]|uniref:DEAD-box ATP-dependent RNA helicase 52C-like n=1 Tax=Olea europaea var. sylvestris TaxID=158386 RepID=UPI000C1CD87C|nr:DEAD-box ATP-dependent RNA helicase 52C-like [Olea europaea var. sylvestris]
MSPPWFTDSAAGLNRSGRPTQPTYLPPFRRDENVTINTSFHGHGRGRGGGNGGGGHGRGRRGGRSGRYFHDENPNNFPLDISQKFNELKVTPEEDDASELNASAYDDTPVEASGTDIPPPVMSFSEICFASQSLIENIKRCKYAKPTPIQRYAIPVAMAGRDLMACAQTGSGKTAAFCFPIISGILMANQKNNSFGHPRSTACPLALILAPTRELSCQIHEEAKKFSYQTGVKVVVAYGGAPIFQQLRNLENGVHILVATPGRLVDMIERERVSLKNVKYLALDEADRMLDMGFEPQVRRIVQQMEMPPPSARQTLLFSATFPTEIQRLASDFLSNYIFVAAGKVGSSTDLIVQRVDFVPDMDKRDHLKNLLYAQKSKGTSGKDALTLVFVETKKGADTLERWLCRRGFPSTAIHGDKVQMEREQALRSFRSGLTPILVATDVAARGLDISNVAHVINFDLPKTVDNYVHRIGRTGRAGKSGLATAFFSEKNAPLAKDLVELMEEANQEIPNWLKEYAETTYIAGNGRSKRFGGSKFAGYDYRSGDYVNGGNGDFSSHYANNSTANPYPYSAPDTSTFVPHVVPAGADVSGFSAVPVAGSNSSGFDYGTVVATGWG